MPNNGLIKENSYYQFQEFLKLGVIAAFSNRKFDLGFQIGIPEEIKKNRKSFLETLSINHEDLVCCQQPHGKRAVVINRKDRGRGAYDFQTAVSNCDALITNCPNLPLAVFCADCLSIFLYAPKNNVVSIIHAGWQGLRDEITKSTVELMMSNFGIKPPELLIGLGPAIRSCCYEVKNEFKDYFTSGLLEREGKLYLDLIAINLMQLRTLGIDENQIIDSKFCTGCRNDEFFSYRREGKNAGRMMSVIMLKGKSALIKRYKVEFTLNSRLASPQLIRNSLLEFGDNLNVAEEPLGSQGIFKIRIDTQDPTIIFDICSQFGRLGYVKVDEICTA